ncbi:gustatory and pheromone receptor 39a-like isoform X1 [Drosophila pseudoobscura]|uniref:Gustatory receptor n=1 Tax=Drosophila pseudoobscura pseudoobscura TaxID=46245 RepID=A0A6I8V9N3_DROPS|nr:gustatory and pheromone receptor 39a isoform X1 [Drosophila pseudoobscura]
MSVCRDLRLYLRALKFLGMMCWQFETERCLLQATPECERYAQVYTVVVLSGTTGALAYAHLQPERFRMKVYNRTGNFYEAVIFRCSCVVLWLLYVCLYLRRHRHMELVQSLLTINRTCLAGSADRQFRNNFVLYGALSGLIFGNHINGYRHAGLDSIALTLNVVLYTYAFLVLCLLLVFFVCLKQIMAAGLTHYNEELRQGIASLDVATIFCGRQKIPSLRGRQQIPALRGRQQLLALCEGELNECFGLLMLPIVALVLLLSPAGPFFLISTVLEGKYGPKQYILMTLTSIFWDVPWMIILFLMLRTNGITVEANKTAKILAKVPRTGTGLDRMIEKFLLKNLRQQPILTAYGFFALDKSTLFKLFTAIFTYMVILVQFKEMENSTKSINKF